MRVELHLDPVPAQSAAEIPWTEPGFSNSFLDLRADPKLIERIEPAQHNAALRTFLAVVNDSASFFFTARCKTWHSPAPNAGAHEFSARVQIAFVSGALNRDFEQVEDLAERLHGLLTNESGADSLALDIFLRKCRFGAGGLPAPAGPPANLGLCLDIELRARGATANQAELRCGLGLARLQQALLFISRALRQKCGELD
jgi:hypothetical protein